MSERVLKIIQYNHCTNFCKAVCIVEQNNEFLFTIIHLPQLILHHVKACLHFTVLNFCSVLMAVRIIPYLCSNLKAPGHYTKRSIVATMVNSCTSDNMWGKMSTHVCFCTLLLFFQQFNAYIQEFTNYILINLHLSAV